MKQIKVYVPVKASEAYPQNEIDIYIKNMVVAGYIKEITLTEDKITEAISGKCISDKAAKEAAKDILKLLQL